MGAQALGERPMTARRVIDELMASTQAALADMRAAAEVLRRNAKDHQEAANELKEEVLRRQTDHPRRSQGRKDGSA